MKIYSYSRRILDEVVRKNDPLIKDLAELDDCVKNMSFEEKIKSIMRHSFNVNDDGEVMSFEDWKNSPEDVEQVFGEMVSSLKCWLIIDYFLKRGTEDEK